jgi:hypothetical protein
MGYQRPESAKIVYRTSVRSFGRCLILSGLGKIQAARTNPLNVSRVHLKGGLGVRRTDPGNAREVAIDCIDPAKDGLLGFLKVLASVLAFGSLGRVFFFTSR